ncbi:uncharacterized protein LOC120355716, partial [Nilaparvata lugens]|uniref:uncharacterized protein LOC120355716 n=1 Tax=Nilaparvata lugens TaxID=108931 RepID=UPI00193E3545
MPLTFALLSFTSCLKRTRYFCLKYVELDARMESGPLNLQLRVQNLVRKLRPERVRSQLQCLITTVSEANAKLLRQNLVSRDCDAKDVVTAHHDDSDGTQDGAQDGTQDGAPTTAVDVQLEESVEQQGNGKDTEEDACKRTVMSAGYSASSEADSGGGVASTHAQRPCQLALSREPSGGPAPSAEPQPMGGGLPLLVIDSPTNENAASGLLCTPCPSPSPRNKSPVTVQEWVDSLPLTPVEPTRPDDEHSEPTTALPATLNEADDILTLGAEAGLLCAGPASTPFPAVQVTTCREPSEAGSHCSSVESLLEARRADPEEVLLGLG